MTCVTAKGRALSEFRRFYLCVEFLGSFKGTTAQTYVAHSPVFLPAIKLQWQAFLRSLLVKQSQKNMYAHNMTKGILKAGKMHTVFYDDVQSKIAICSKHISAQQQQGCAVTMLKQVNYRKTPSYVCLFFFFLCVSVITCLLFLCVALKYVKHFNVLFGRVPQTLTHVTSSLQLGSLHASRTQKLIYVFCTYVLTLGQGIEQ